MSGCIRAIIRRRRFSPRIRWLLPSTGRLRGLDGCTSLTWMGLAAVSRVILLLIEAIVKRVSLPVQLGGGIRDEATVARLLDIGVNRVILGTVAVENPGLVKSLCRKYGEAIVVGIDARIGCVATRGWKKDTEITALELGLKMADLGVRRIIYTDIKRDGTLTEPGFEAIAEMVKGVNCPSLPPVAFQLEPSEETQGSSG